jgi:hypothetical protein
MAVAGFLGVAFFNGVPLALVMMLFVFLAGGGVTASIAPVDAAIVTALLAIPALAATIRTPVPAAPAPAVWKDSDFRDGISSIK